MAPAASPYLRHRFPPEIIAQCVLLSMRFPLSFRAVEEAMLLRGVQVSYETIRRWCRKFAQQFANELRRRRPKPGDKWLCWLVSSSAGSVRFQYTVSRAGSD